jgi:opacity protein-like surface antigen
MIARLFVFAVAAVVAAGSAAFAADHSTREASAPYSAELCCAGAIRLPPIETSGASDSRGVFGLNQAARDAKPGFDGADWSCRRPDGSRRCFSSLRHP